jgi:hypothetical protein
VDPRKRRAASSYVFETIFKEIKQRDDIEIASSTMNLTVQNADSVQPQTADKETSEEKPKAA